MKQFFLLLLAVSLLGGIGFSGTLDVWTGPGSFSDDSQWQSGGPSTWTSTSGSDEIKITSNDSPCTVDTDAGSFPYRLSVSSGPVGGILNVVDGGSLGMGELRIGADGATGAGDIGYLNVTGGSLSVKDLLLGRKGGAEGYATISGGTITYNSGDTGRIYVGAGAGASDAPNTGVLTIVGSDASIVFDTLYVGASDSSHYGTGTLEYAVGAAGVSEIEISDIVSLDAAGDTSHTHLVVSTTEATLPDEDIVLVNFTGASSVEGVFDTFNGGSAAEGTDIILADNIYYLSYQHAVGGGTDNDIALVYVAGTDERPHSPNPVNESTVSSSPLTLSWVNPDPNDGVSPITCTVYFGTEPNTMVMDSATLGANESSVEINSTKFENYGAQPLPNGTLFYWLVSCDDPSSSEPVMGSMWSFTTDYNVEPTVDAGDDQVVWLGKSGVPAQEVVSLNGTVSDDGRPNPPGAYTVQWTQFDNGAPDVTISPDNLEDTTVTITEAGTYIFVLTADDTDKQNSDSVEVIVGQHACQASHMSSGSGYDPGDVNQDCIVDLEDFVELISRNWLDCTDTLTNCVN